MNLYEVPKAGVVSNSNVGLKPKGRNLWGLEYSAVWKGKTSQRAHNPFSFYYTQLTIYYLVVVPPGSQCIPAAVVAPGSQCILAAVVTPVLKSIPAAVVSPGLQSIPASVVTPGSQSIPSGPSASIQSRGRGRKKLLVDPTHQSVPGIAFDSKSTPPVSSITSAAECLPPGPSASVQIKGQSRKTQTEAGIPRCRVSQNKSEDSVCKAIVLTSNQKSNDCEPRDISQDQASRIAGQDQKFTAHLDDATQNGNQSACQHQMMVLPDQFVSTFPGQILSTDMRDVATVTEELPAENSSAKANFDEQAESSPRFVSVDADGKSIHQVAVKIASNSEPTASYPSISPAFESIPPESLQVKRQGRKAPNRAEAPRRRGKKQGPVSPSVDTLVGQDLKANPQSQNKSRDRSGSNAISLRSKQESDIEEPANVSQEIFSETCSSKRKIETTALGISVDSSRQSDSGVGVMMEEDHASALGVNMEVSCTVPVSVGVKEIVPCRPAPGLLGPSPGSSKNEIDSKLASQGPEEPSSLEHPKVSEIAANASDFPRVTLPTTIEPCDNNSMKKMELSAKASPPPVIGVENPVISANPDGVSCHSGVSTQMPASPGPDSVARSILVLAKTASGNIIESSLQDSLDARGIPSHLQKILEAFQQIAYSGVDRPTESASISASFYLSDNVKLPDTTLNDSKDEIEPSSKESPELCALDIRSIKSFTNFRIPNALADHPPVPRSISGSQENLSDVDLVEGFTSRSDRHPTKDKAAAFTSETVVECPEASVKANNLGADLPHCDVTSSCNNDTLC
ncbi:hypothetical protein GH714_002384 [Hevea brasiliensis]|uniref:Uncharacterized protein n=1 Tax=Hevea brasiliensis TaxID=3981 RepID=A0A6A6KHC8_HEVBR|nr:hypothetical protein GH714_002384 [Hevea brasiliensis]